MPLAIATDGIISKVYRRTDLSYPLEGEAVVNMDLDN